MFTRASNALPRAKIFLWGEAGTGKTTFALRWGKHGGKVAVMDTEASTHRYDKEFEFYRFEPRTMEEVDYAVHYLATKPHEFTTLLIDSVTIIWDFNKIFWEKRFLDTRVGKKGHNGSFYELQPRDWDLVKGHWKRFFANLRKLDMNVIGTCRAKPMYAPSTGGDDMMKRIGDTFDSDRSTAYEFDTELAMTKLVTGQYIATTKKHRSEVRPMPPTIDITGGGMSVFVDHFGDAITRKSIPIVLITAETKAEIEKCVAFLAIDPNLFQQAVVAKGFQTIEDMHESIAKEVLEKLKKDCASKTPF